jgi:hypothetical protein
MFRVRALERPRLQPGRGLLRLVQRATNILHFNLPHRRWSARSVAHDRHRRA